MTGLGILFHGWRSDEGKERRGNMVHGPERTENASPVFPAALSGSEF